MSVWERGSSSIRVKKEEERKSERETYELNLALVEVNKRNWESECCDVQAIDSTPSLLVRVWTDWDNFGPLGLITFLSLAQVFTCIRSPTQAQAHSLKLVFSGASFSLR